MYVCVCGGYIWQQRRYCCCLLNNSRLLTLDCWKSNSIAIAYSICFLHNFALLEAVLAGIIISYVYTCTPPKIYCSTKLYFSAIFWFCLPWYRLVFLWAYFRGAYEWFNKNIQAIFRLFCFPFLIVCPNTFIRVYTILFVRTFFLKFLVMSTTKIIFIYFSINTFLWFKVNKLVLLFINYI